MSFSAQPKYGREAILQPAKIKKGHTRWNQFQDILHSINPSILDGPVLDFGSGIGYFILEGLRRNINIWGVDILPGKIKRYQRLIEFSESSVSWKNRCVAGDGTSLPFKSNYFSAITSWFVFEHIPNPEEVLRELVRILKVDGVLVLRAQDARCTWEGHCKIPWIPFLPENLARIWIDEFDTSAELREGVYAITQPQVIGILKTLGCSIIKKDKDLPPLDPEMKSCCNEQQIRQIARRMKEELANGTYIPRQDGLYIYAQKKEI